MNQKGISVKEVMKQLEIYSKMDTSYHKVLSSMCTTPHPIALKSHIKFIESNLGDLGLYPGTKLLEDKVISLIGELMGNKNAVGYITTGGTESNIQAIRAARNLSNKKHPNIVLPKSAHFSFDKIADILSIEVRKAELDSQFRVNIDSVKNLIDENTIAIVGIAGSTEFGQIDPIKELSEIALSRNLFLHIDAAFGGFVIPFLEKKYEIGFSLKGVSSITIDPHKMGMSTIPAGCLLFKDDSFMKPLEIDTPYLTTDKQYSLTGTRSGAVVASIYAVMMHLGMQGYKEIVDRCMKMTYKLVDSVKEFGIKPLIYPVMNIATLDIPNLYVVKQKLMEKGWFTSVTREPSGLRLVIMPHLNDDIIEDFVYDLKNCVFDY